MGLVDAELVANSSAARQRCKLNKHEDLIFVLLFNSVLKRWVENMILFG